MALRRGRGEKGPPLLFPSRLVGCVRVSERNRSAPCRNELRHEPNGRNRPCAGAAIGRPITAPRCLGPTRMDLTWRSRPGRVWPLSPRPAAPPLLTSVPPPFGAPSWTSPQQLFHHHHRHRAPSLCHRPPTHKIETEAVVEAGSPCRPLVQGQKSCHYPLATVPRRGLDPITSHPAISQSVSHRPRGETDMSPVSTHEPR